MGSASDHGNINYEWKGKHKDYIEQMDVQSQINQTKELPITGHLYVLLRQFARMYSASFMNKYPMDPSFTL